jgi:hypothetical protein
MFSEMNLGPQLKRRLYFFSVESNWNISTNLENPKAEFQ